MDIFDKMHKEHFDELFGANLSEADKELLREHFKSLGIDDEQAKKILKEMHLIRPGHDYGHAHLCDIEQIVERALFGQGNKAITVKISQEGYDEEMEDGHLLIEVLEVVKGRD